MKLQSEALPSVQATTLMRELSTRGVRRCWHTARPRCIACDRWVRLSPTQPKLSLSSTATLTLIVLWRVPAGTMLVFVVAATKIQASWRGWLVRHRPQYGHGDVGGAAFVMQSRRRHMHSMRPDYAISPLSPDTLSKPDSIGWYATEQALLASQEAERAMALVAAARSQLPSLSR